MFSENHNKKKRSTKRGNYSIDSKNDAMCDSMVSKEQKFPADFTNSSYKKAIDSFYNKKKSRNYRNKKQKPQK
jgi:hypothetical protein